MTTNALDVLDRLLTDWQEADWTLHSRQFYQARGRENYERDYPTRAIFGPVWTKLNIGRSGAFMLHNETGAIVGIKGYGKPDVRKYVGQLGEVTGEQLVGRRWMRPNLPKGASAIRPQAGGYET